jgi:hypothetical protein
MRDGVLGLLLGLKLRLMVRTVSRAGRLRGIASLLLVAVAFAPLWLGMTSVAYSSARQLGGTAVVTGFGAIHLTWMATSLLMGSYAEGFDLRLLLRYPVPPRDAFWLNVLVAPVDFVAFFLLPPLGGLVAGSAVRAGTAAGCAVAAAGIVLLFTTTAIAQVLLALLGRHLKREWTRALFGLLVGVAFIIPSIILRSGQGAQPPAGSSVAAAGHWLKASLAHAESVFVWLPTTALPARAALAALDHHAAGAALFLVAAFGALLLLVRICAGVAVSEAMNRQAPSTGGTAGAEAGAAGLEGWLERLLPTDLAILVARDLRTFSRTPQILLGLLMAPAVVVFLNQQHHLQIQGGIFLVAFAPLTAALNLAANHFGLDQAGVRLLFLLPISARRLLISKNIACASVATVGVAACLLTTVFFGPHLDALGVFTAIATMAAALPVVLTFGNRLSVRSPWRMSFRLGGAPPGAMSSAFSQMFAVAIVALALAPGLLLLPAIQGDGLGVRLASLWITATIAAGLWTAWFFILPGAAAALDARRELIIDRLAKASESG